MSYVPSSIEQQHHQLNELLQTTVVLGLCAASDNVQHCLSLATMDTFQLLQTQLLNY